MLPTSEISAREASFTVLRVPVHGAIPFAFT